MNASASSAGGIATHMSLRQRMFASPETKHLAEVIDAGVEQVELGIRENILFADPLADVSARYLFEAGGKRVRPMLTLLISQLGKGATPQVITSAQAIEITHLASLYHDDVMDEAPLRRGVPSTHEVWGNSVAILTGDLLFSRASSLMASLGLDAMKLQTTTFERLCLGQLHETLGPQPGEDPIDHYIRVLSDKTGSLIATAARCGIIYSDAPEEYEDAVVTFGEKIGVAFQLADDVLDLAPNSDETGKSAGTDLRAGVPTLPTLILEQQAATDPHAAALLERIRLDVTESDPDFTAAVAELYAHPVTAQTRDEARRWAHEAVEALSVLPEGPVKQALSAFADHVVSRTA